MCFQKLINQEAFCRNDGYQGMAAQTASLAAAYFRTLAGRFKLIDNVLDKVHGFQHDRKNALIKILVVKAFVNSV